MIVAEWGNPAQAIPAGFHSDFLLGFNSPGWVSLFRKRGEGHWRDSYAWSFFDESGHGDIREFLDEYFPYLDASKEEGYIALITGNHDETPRLANGRDTAQLKLIYLFLLTMPGTPFIYYGDEIGMRSLDLPSKEGGYERTGARTPMQWSEAANAGFSEAVEEKLYLPIDPAPERPTVEAQDHDTDSLLNRVRSLIKLRQSLTALEADAAFNVVYAESGKLPFVYTRVKDGQHLVVAINPAGYPAQVVLPADTFSTEPAAVDVPHGARFTRTAAGWALALPPVSGAVYRMDG